MTRDPETLELIIYEQCELLRKCLAYIPFDSDLTEEVEGFLEANKVFS